jgi:steroid delta-isomerase-like uncharacterized protein
MTTTIAAPAIADPQAVQELCLRWGRAWNTHDAAAVAALCTEDLVYDEPALGDTVHGRDSIHDFVARLAVTYPDHRFSLEGLYADIARSSVLVAWRFEGTRAGTGQCLDFHGDDRLDLNADGLIAAYRCLYDHDLVLRQLGGGTPSL